MIRRSTAALAACTILLGCLSAPPAASQTAGEILTVRDVTPWVSAEGEWVVRWGISPEIPSDAQISLTIRQPLRVTDLRGAVSRVMGGGSTGAPLQDPITVPLESIRSGDEAVLRVPIRPRSGPTDRVLIPNPGIHPVDVTLSASGTSLAREVLFLNRLPERSERSPLLVAPYLAAQASSTIGPDGSVSVRAADLDSTRSVLRTLRDRSSSALTVGLDPHLLDALEVTDPQLREDLLGAIGRRPVLRSSWVPIDIESWASTGRLVDIQSTVTAGSNTVAEATGALPAGQVWRPDMTVGPVSVSALRSIGVRHLVLDPGRVAPARELRSDLGSTQRFVVEGSDGAIDALVLDAALAVRLRGDQPGLSAHRAATELVGMWFAAPASSKPAAVVDLTGVDSETASEFLAALAIPSEGVIRSVDLARAFADSSAYTTGRAATTLTRRLVEREDVPDVSALSAYLARLRVRMTALQSTMADRPGIAPVPDLVLGSQDRSLGQSDQRALLDAAARRIDEDLRSFVLPAERTVTITARTSTLPFRIENRSGRRATVTLRLRGTRLQFAQGPAQVVQLERGVNSLKLPVLVRTSGQFRTVLEVRTGNDVVAIGSTPLRVRSTVVSGVGVVLAGGALTFLVIWWTITIRRSRRHR